MNKNGMIYKIVSKIKELFFPKKKEKKTMSANKNVVINPINQESDERFEVVGYLMKVIQSSDEDFEENVKEFDKYMHKRYMEQVYQELVERAGEESKEEASGPRKVLRLHSGQYTIH